jgi:hypothetical protein
MDFTHFNNQGWKFTMRVVQNHDTRVPAGYPAVAIVRYVTTLKAAKDDVLNRNSYPYPYPYPYPHPYPYPYLTITPPLPLKATHHVLEHRNGATRGGEAATRVCTVPDQDGSRTVWCMVNRFRATATLH